MASGVLPATTAERFRNLDAYRVQRERQRLEGTAQRDLFRQLRVRFLLRHSTSRGPALELGPGPGRFTPFVGGPGTRRVLLDLSLSMLNEVRERIDTPTKEPIPDLVVGDGRSPPFRSRSFGEVVVLGNALGFAGPSWDRLLGATLDLVAPGGTVILETIAGGGERSRYLSRLPPTAVRRLLRSPLRALAPRILREGFEAVKGKEKARHGFQRLGEADLAPAFRSRGFRVREALAVAPALGVEPEHAEAIAADPSAWAALLRLEELLGSSPARRAVASALLLAAERTGADHALGETARIK
ncbi:MAG: class I SAM-dependent methyltransferase [Thermoplasmata archaeon]|nr:class I SAM-dependent methyltransferase [Thermoplasmata archaeon]